MSSDEQTEEENKIGVTVCRWKIEFEVGTGRDIVFIGRTVNQNLVRNVARQRSACAGGW